ncbi:MAG TPA: polymer-forming cytoskeletal protein, partial [Vicinamibacterales bacterium]
MTVIGHNVAIDGEVAGDGDLTVEGRVTGWVVVRDGTLTIAPSARIDGDLRAPRIVVRGHVRGAVQASERIELAPTAVVEGGLSADRIAIADGAWFTGLVDMGRRTIAAKVAEYRA